jgi:hypothetical protein
MYRVYDSQQRSSLLNTPQHGAFLKAAQMIQLTKNKVHCTRRQADTVLTHSSDLTARL